MLAPTFYQGRKIFRCEEMFMRQSLTPYLTLSDAAAAIEFYKKAFGAEEVARHSAPDGKRLMHAHLKVLSMDLMLSDDFPEHMGRSRTPEAFGGSPVTLYLQTDDVDSLWANALAAADKETMPLKTSSGAIGMGSSPIRLDIRGRRADDQDGKRGRAGGSGEGGVLDSG
jgi:PhnB protein